MTDNRLLKENDLLKHMEALNKLLSKEATLKRGYSLTTKDGAIIKNAKEVNKGNLLKTHLEKGEIVSEVKDKEK